VSSLPACFSLPGDHLAWTAAFFAFAGLGFLPAPPSWSFRRYLSSGAVILMFSGSVFLPEALSLSLGLYLSSEAVVLGSRARVFLPDDSSQE
jgi:hypothetical protein